MAEVLIPQALCTDADAKAAGSIGVTGSKATSDEWINKVNAASVAFLNVSGREIVSGDATRPGGVLTIPQAARVFDARELLWIACEPPELELGDAAAIASVSIVHKDGTSSALASTDWTKLPLRRRYAWEPIEALEFSDAIRWMRGDTITVTGTWGFPSVPPDVRGAVARAAYSWIAQDVRRYGEVFSNEENTSPPDPGAAHVLPRYAWEIAMGYHRSRFG